MRLDWRMNEKVGALNRLLCRLTSMSLTIRLSLPRPKAWANRRSCKFRGVLHAIFLSIFISSLVVAKAEQPIDTVASVPGVVGREVTADLVNLIFLFDRVGAKPPKVITRDYLERVSQPSSPFYRDYVAYREGKIDRAQLANRLPHVAMLGDSLTQHFYLSSMPSSFWRARTVWRNNWFVDTDPAPKSVLSFYERMEQVTPLVAEEHNGAGAWVAPKESHESLRQRVVRARNFSGQTRVVLRQSRFPDLIMIWIGHNNLDWVHGLSPEQRAHPDKHLAEIASHFRRDYAESLRPLINRAKTENHKVAIMVFGLANIDAYLKARHRVAALKANNPNLYPYFQEGEKSFESLKPPYQKNMARLAVMLNREMRSLVAELNGELRGSPSVRLEYSDELTKVDLSRVDLINTIDAYHFSIKGHTTVAEAAWKATGPTLRFLGINQTRQTRPSTMMTAR
jgi:lysophospholipase L1-like esterase